MIAVKIDEIVVNGKKTQDNSEIAKEIKRFWEEIGGMYDDDPVRLLLKREIIV